MNALSILEMHQAIDQAIQKFGFFVYQDMDTEQIDLQINLSIDELLNGIIDKFFGSVPKTSPQVRFQIDQVTLDNIKTLHVKDQSVSLTELPDKDGYSFPIPAPYAYHIRTKVITSKQCGDEPLLVTTNIRILESQNNNRNHPFHKTSNKSPLAEVSNGIFTIYTEGEFTITSASISYIKKPAKVLFGKTIDGDYDANTSIQCDLDPTLHRLVIDMTAIRIAKILEQSQQKVVNLQQQTV